MTGVLLLVGACGPDLPPGASWNHDTGTFRWWNGEISLPQGYTYELGGGGDSYGGSFTSPDRQMVVEHDIGAYAGIWAHGENSVAFHERIVDGSRVWTATRAYTGAASGTYLVAASFPDAGYANFFIRTRSPQRDAAVIEGIAKSFRPRKL